MEAIERRAGADGWETLSVYGRRKGFSDLPSVKCGNGFFFWLHVALTTAFDLQGLGSILPTGKMIRILRKEKPDIIQLHNIHGYYLNYPMLFRYLKREYQGSVVWTLHDCWAYTGHCAFFTVGCDRWKTGCHNCPHEREYPWSLGLDNSSYNWRKKRESFQGVPRMTVVIPSEWIAGNVRQSFLADYPVRVIPNGTDLSVFRPMIGLDEIGPGDSPDDAGRKGQERQKLYERYGIPEGSRILLGVASAWNERKGMQVFRELAKMLAGDSRQTVTPERSFKESNELQKETDGSSECGSQYCIVLVGMNAAQRQSMPTNIVHIERTENRQELARLYSAAEVLINPSLEESFSMVTVESLACGTPVIALDTSAVKELVPENCGVILHAEMPEGGGDPVQPDAAEYRKAVHQIEDEMRTGNISEKTCRAQAAKYTEQAQIDGYMKLYQECLADQKQEQIMG